MQANGGGASNAWLDGWALRRLEGGGGGALRGVGSVAAASQKKTGFLRHRLRLSLRLWRWRWRGERARARVWGAVVWHQGVSQPRPDSAHLCESDTEGWYGGSNAGWPVLRCLALVCHNLGGVFFWI